MILKKNDEFILEPIRFALSEKLMIGGDATRLDSSVELIEDYKLAVRLSSEQNLPNKYHVWQDAIDNAVGEFRLNKSYPDAEDFISEVDEQFSIHQSALSLNYRRLKLKKINSSYDDFYMKVIGGIYYQLRAVTLQRYILREREESFLEKNFRVYLSGFYPCGLKKDGCMVAFNPVLLK